MNIRNKLAYGILGILGFLPIVILVIIQSVFALEASYDSKLVINANDMKVVDIKIYDSYNEDITSIIETKDDDGKPILFSVIEATSKYLILDFHGGKIDDNQVSISSIQFILEDETKTELLNGIVYLQFKNVAMTEADINWARDAWIRDFIEDFNELYKIYYEKPAGTISYIWLKIITASIGTILGLVSVLFVLLRKSTKALVKRYWRIAVLVAFIEATIILGLIAWIVVDIFQVFAAATVGWIIFLGGEKFAKFKGYLEIPAKATVANSLVPPEVQLSIDAILAQYRK